MGRRRRGLSVVAGLAAVVALLAGPGTAGAAQPAASERSYRVEGVADRAARTAVARIRRLGHRVTLLGPAQAPAAAGPKAFPPADSGYHDYAELASEVAGVANAYPNLVRRFSVGRSYQNRELWAAKVSDNVAADEAEPEVLF